MKRIKIWILFFSIFGLVSASFANTPDPLSIEQVASKIEPGKIAGQNFSIIIKVNVINHTIKKWALGFYMPRTFNQLVNKSGTAINPNLKMQVCDISTPNQCSDLQLVKTGAAQISAGYTTILSPVNPGVALELGKTVQFQLMHNNQWAPSNLSSMPQHFFLIENGLVTPITEVAPHAYFIDGYHDAQVKANIVQHNKDNWFNSKPRLMTNIADQYHIVPTPVTIIPSNGPAFLFSPTISISDDFQNADKNNRDFFQQYFHFTAVDQPANAVIQIQKIATLPPEGYELKITSKNIIIQASTPTGVFYAIQTLKQLKKTNNALPSLLIQDYPRFKYRGILLDTSRHYFSVDEIKKLMDVMAAQKLNSLHMHFSDDEGWRIEMPSFPQLTSMGSVRGFAPGSIQQPSLFEQANLDISNHEGFSPTGKLIQSNYPKANELYKGYYSQNDIKNLIDYANARQITVIPEIDLPGHAKALINAMPTVFKDPKDHSQFISVQGYTDDVIPVCLYETKQGGAFTQTIDSIVAKLANVFSHQSTLYHQNEISLGGDEVSSDVWTNDDSCLGQWATLSALDKSHYFFSLLHRKADALFSGWQQFVQSDGGFIGKYAIHPEQTAHIWVWETTGNGSDQKGIQDAARLINAGYPTVLAFADETYFDLMYTPNQWEPGFSWATGYSDTEASLRSAQDANAVEKFIQENQKNNLLGLEGTLWSENITNFNHLAYMTLPKMAGLAEAAWSSKIITTTDDGKINWQSLSYRLGYDNNGFLGFLYQLSGMKYRGYPNGISEEVPTTNP